MQLLLQVLLQVQCLALALVLLQVQCLALALVQVQCLASLALGHQET